MSLGLDDFFGGQPNEIASPIPPRIRRAMHSIALKQFGGLCLLGGLNEKQLVCLMSRYLATPVSPLLSRRLDGRWKMEASFTS